MTSTCDHYAFDAQVRTEHGIFCGVDEAGRGPLCGPVCCAAVILNPDDPIEGIDDSKKLSEKKREAHYEVICDRALAWNVVLVGPDVIDRDNILNATMSGMRQAVEGLDIVPNFVLVDGNRCPAGLTMPCGSQVKGDGVSASIGAASILASVEPVMASLIGVFLFREKISLPELCGIIMVLVSVVICSRQEGD